MNIKVFNLLVIINVIWSLSFLNVLQAKNTESLTHIFYSNKISDSLIYQNSYGLNTHVPNRLEVVSVLKDSKALDGVHDIEIQNGLAFLAGKGGSLAIVDVKNPLEPKLLWYINNEIKFDEAETVLPIDSTHLLIGTRDVLMFDIAAPDSPKLLSMIQNRNNIDLINGFARKNDFVFGANKQGTIFSVDISDPSNIKFAGSLNVRELGILDSPHDIDFCGDLLVIVSPEGFGRGESGKIAIYKVFGSNSEGSINLLPPEQWELVSQMEHTRFSGANRVDVKGKYACIGSSLYTNIGREDNLRSNVSLIDLSDPSNPKLRSSIDFPDKRGPNGLVWNGDVVYAAGGQTIHGIDFSDPEIPVQKAILFCPEAFPGGKDDAHDLVQMGEYLFVTAQSSCSLVIVRIASEVVNK